MCYCTIAWAGAIEKAVDQSTDHLLGSVRGSIKNGIKEAKQVAREFIRAIIETLTIVVTGWAFSYIVDRKTARMIRMLVVVLGISWFCRLISSFLL